MVEEIDKKIVFILGAGTSRELKFSTRTMDIVGTNDHLHQFLGLLSDGFIYYIHYFVEYAQKKSFALISEPKIYNDWLKDFILDYYYGMGNGRATWEDVLANKEISEKINIEKIYIEVEKYIERLNAQKIPLSEKTWFMYSAKRDLLKYVHSALSIVSYCCYSHYHRILANYIVLLRARVISFNWDILLEEEMWDTGKWDYRDGYGFLREGFIDKNIALPDECRYRERSQDIYNKILKPHGSINWYRKGDSSPLQESDKPNIYIGMPITRKDARRGGTTVEQGRLRFSEFDPLNGQYESIILPPGTKKLKLPFIWRPIKEILESADEIISIGFSFNAFDTDVADKFRNFKYKDDVVVKIVSPQQEIVTRYQEIFHNAQVYKIHSLFSKYCGWIVDQDGMNAFRQLA